MVALLVALASATVGCNAENRPDAAQDLIDAFAGSCSSRGAWTDSALSHTNALINVLTKIKTTGPCAALNGNLSQIQSMNGQLSYLLNSSNAQAYNYNQEMIQELTLALGEPTLDATAVASLNSALVNAQTQSALLSASAGSLGNTVNATAVMATSMQSLVQQAGDLSYCFNESPAAALKLATNAMAIGGSFISPVVGAGAATLGTLLNGVIDYVRNHGTNQAIWRAHSDKMPLALTCGLESMTKLYCQANDALDLIEFQRKNYPKLGEPPSPAWTGMDLIGRRLPVLTKWLLRVKTGTPPNDTNESAKQIAIWEKIQAVENADIKVLGMIHGARQLYDGAANDTDRRNVIAGLVTAFANYATPVCAPGNQCWGPLTPFSAQTSYYTCWLVDGYRDVSQGTDPSCPFFNYQSDTVEGYVRKNLMGHADIGKFEANWRGIFQAAYALYNVEFSQTITLNPGELLRLAYDHPPGNISPHDVLLMLRDYVTGLLSSLDETNPNDRPVMQETLDMINASLAVIENRDPLATTVQERIRKLVDVLDLKHSARSFLQLVQELAATDIQKRLERGELPKHVTDMVRAAGLEIRDKLTQSGVDDLGNVVTDLNSARSLTEGNVTNFRKYFLHAIVKAIKALQASAHPKEGVSEPNDGINRPHGQVLAKLCMLVISTGENFPDKDTAAVCRAQTLFSLYSDDTKAIDPLTVHVDELEKRLRGRPLRERFCTYYKFSRAERLAELLEKQRRSRQFVPAFEPESLGGSEHLWGLLGL